MVTLNTVTPTKDAVRVYRGGRVLLSDTPIGNEVAELDPDYDSSATQSNVKWDDDPFFVSSSNWNASNWPYYKKSHTGTLSSVTISGGTSYADGDTLTISDGNKATATVSIATADLTGGVIDSTTFTTISGTKTGYDVSGNYTVSGGSGSGATVDSFTVTGAYDSSQSETNPKWRDNLRSGYPYPALVRYDIEKTENAVITAGEISHTVRSLEGPSLSDGEVDITSINDTWAVKSTGGMKMASFDITLMMEMESQRGFFRDIFGKTFYMSVIYESGSVSPANPEIFGEFIITEMPMGSVDAGGSDVSELSITCEAVGTVYEFDGTNVTEYGK